MSNLARVVQWNTFARVWHLFDAKWQNPIESSVMLAKYLRGMHKPIYHPLSDCGDHVVVINSKWVAFPGNEWRRRVYFHHTGYPGGASWTAAWELHDKDPTLVLKKAIYRCMKGNLQRRHTMCRLHIYPETDVPKEIYENISNEIPQLRPVPRRLDSYSNEEVETFPKIMDYPTDYVYR